MGRVALLSVLSSLGLVLAAHPGKPDKSAECPSFSSDHITESSGLVESRQFKGVFWTHNDSGDTNRIFAIRSNGELIAEIVVDGATNEDWEDISVDDFGNLYIADTGNNDNVRRDLKIYRLKEPNPFDEKPRGKVDMVIGVSFPDQKKFPDKKHLNFDAEAMFVLDRTIYLMSKHRSDTKTDLYRVPDLKGKKRKSVVLVHVGTFDVGGADKPYGGQVSAADVSPDGKYLAVLTYHALFIFQRERTKDDYLDHLVKQIPFDQDHTIQCEAIAWTDTGDLIFTNEQGHIHLLRDVFAMKQYPPVPETPSTGGGTGLHPSSRHQSPQRD